MNISAQVRCFSPNTRMSTMAIFCAAPLLATSLPNIAPMQTMPSKPPRMLPTPFSSTPGTLSMGRPSRMRRHRRGHEECQERLDLSPADEQHQQDDRRENVHDIHLSPADERRVSETRAVDVQADARQHVVRRQVQRLAVVAELAVRRGLAIADAAETLAFLRQHQDAARGRS